MAGKSKIDALDQDIRAEINRLILGGATLDQIVAWLRKVGIDDISRSGVQRYSVSDVIREMKLYREMSSTFATELGTKAETEQHEVITQMIMSLLMKASAARVTGDEAADPLDLARMARTVKTLMSSTIDREALRRQVEKEVREEAAREAATAVDQAAQEMGWDLEQVAFIRAKILGVKVVEANG